MSCNQMTNYGLYLNHILFQYADITQGLNRYRGTQANLPTGYAEAFYIDSVNNYLNKNYKIPL